MDEKLNARLELLERQINRYRPNNAQLQIGKNIFELFFDELRRLCEKVYDQPYNSPFAKGPGIPTKQPVNQPVGEAPVEKNLGEDPRSVGKTEANDGGIDDLLEGFKGGKKNA